MRILRMSSTIQNDEKDFTSEIKIDEEKLNTILRLVIEQEKTNINTEKYSKPQLVSRIVGIIESTVKDE